MDIKPIRLQQQLNFIIEIDKMKDVLRQTLLTDGSRRENDAEHSWHLAMLAMTFLEYAQDSHVNITRVLKMALVHDLIEIYAGDTFAYDTVGYEDKQQREDMAADRLFAMLPEDQGKEFRSLWEEFDEMQTPDAVYASAMDRLQPILNNYMTDGHTWKIGNVTSTQVYKRMEPIRRAAPELWQVVEFIIEDGIRKGNLERA